MYELLALEEGVSDREKLLLEDRSKLVHPFPRPKYILKIDRDKGSNIMKEMRSRAGDRLLSDLIPKR